MSATTIVANNLVSSVSGADVNLNLVASGTGNIIANDALIKEVVDPVDDQDAATKKYVDNTVAGGFTFTPISYAGVETEQDIPGKTTALTDEFNTYISTIFDATTVQALLVDTVNGRSYSPGDASLYAPILVASFATQPSLQDWLDRYLPDVSVDNQVVGTYATTNGASLDDILFFNTQTNMARGWSPVTNLVLDQDGLNYKLMLAPGAKSYFTQGSQFFRRSVIDEFVRLSPNDFEVPGYVPKQTVLSNDNVDVVIATIDTLTNGDQLTDFKILSHLTGGPAKWVAEFILHVDSGELLIGSVSITDTFLVPAPVLLTVVAIAPGSSTFEIRARGREAGIVDAAASFNTKVDVENVINPE